MTLLNHVHIDAHFSWEEVHAMFRLLKLFVISEDSGTLVSECLVAYHLT